MRTAREHTDDCLESAFRCGQSVRLGWRSTQRVTPNSDHCSPRNRPRRPHIDRPHGCTFPQHTRGRAAPRPASMPTHSAAAQSRVRPPGLAKICCREIARWSPLGRRVSSSSGASLHAGQDGARGDYPSGWLRHRDALAPQLPPDLPDPIHPEVGIVDAHDLLLQFRIPQRLRRRRPRFRGTISGRSSRRLATDRLDPDAPLCSSMNSTSGAIAGRDSRAKKADAALRISFARAAHGFPFELSRPLGVRDRSTRPLLSISACLTEVRSIKQHPQFSERLDLRR
jgi:hypothetical protein